MAAEFDILAKWLDAISTGSSRRSVSSFQGNGVTTSFNFNFSGGYISPADVKAYVYDDVAKTSTAIASPVLTGPNTIQVTPALSNTKWLVVYRNTSVDAPLVDFSAGAPMTEDNLDHMAEQSTFSAAELVDRFDATSDKATTALSQSTTALTNANTALSQSSAAVTSANAAVSTANAASTTANAANTKADQALGFTLTGAPTNGNNTFTGVNTFTQPVTVADATNSPHAVNLGQLNTASVTRFNTRAGAVTLTSLDVTGALGFTPYDASNPAGYTTAAANAASATKLQTPRAINGVNFDGTSAISITQVAGSNIWTAATLTNNNQLSNGAGYQLASGYTASDVYSKLQTVWSPSTFPQSVSGARWNCLPVVDVNGVMELGRTLDFHVTNADATDYSYRLVSSAADIRFITPTVAAGLVFDSSGNVLIGEATSTSSASNRGLLAINGASQAITAYDIAGVNVGMTGPLTGTAMDVWGAATIPVRIMHAPNAERIRFETTGHVSAGVDNAQTFGSASKRWSQFFAGTGTINTSDAREKTAVAELNFAEIAAASQLSREVGTYQFLTAVAAKGAGARHHVGMTVQRAIEVMESHGLDPFAYGFICYDTWDGGDRYGFRTDELALFLAAGLEARLTAAGL